MVSSDQKLLAEAYGEITKQKPIIPKIGDIVMKSDVNNLAKRAARTLDKQPHDDKEYVVVGVVSQGVWIYPLGNIDYENTTPELVFTRELAGFSSEG